MSYFDPDGNYNTRGKPRKKPTYGVNHAYVLRSLRKGPLTDEGIYDRITRHKGKVISPSGARTRRQELVEDFGYVESVGTGLTEAGRKCSRWGLTDSGRVKANSEFEASRQLSFDTERAA